MAKIHEIRRVWHVGAFPAPRPAGQRALSYEGDGLSVSVHPAEWARIARLGDRAVALERRDGRAGRFLDGYTTRDEARVWGLAAGLVVATTLYRATGVDFTSEAAARSEHPRAKALPVAGFAPAPSFTAWLAATYGTWPGPAYVPPAFEGEMANRYASALDPDLDGVWWTHDYRPETLSCPAGLILPARVANWTVVEEIVV